MGCSPHSQRPAQAGECSGQSMEAASDIRQITLLDDYLPRKYGVATFTSGVRREFLRAQTGAWTGREGES